MVLLLSLKWEKMSNDFKMILFSKTVVCTLHPKKLNHNRNKLDIFTVINNNWFYVSKMLKVNYHWNVMIYAGERQKWIFFFGNETFVFCFVDKCSDFWKCRKMTAAHNMLLGSLLGIFIRYYSDVHVRSSRNYISTKYVNQKPQYTAMCRYKKLQ